MLNKNKFLQYEHRSMVKNNDVMALEIINYKIEKHLTCKKEHLNSKFLNNQINLSKTSSVKRGLGYVDESITPSCVNTNFAKVKKVIPN